MAERFDRIASIEMFEAVGEQYWPVFFAIFERLKPGGVAALQIITIADEFFETYRRKADFIQRYVFPGGMLPSPSALRSQVKAAGLEWLDDSGFGAHYAMTLAQWRQRFRIRLAGNPPARLRRALSADVELLPRLLRGGIQHGPHRSEATGRGAAYKVKSPLGCRILIPNTSP